MSLRSIEAGRAVVRVVLDRTKLVRGLKQAQRSFVNFGSSIKKVGVGLFAVGAGVVAAFVPVFNVFADFDDQSRKLAAVLGTTTSQIGPLIDEAKRLGSETAFTASAVGSLQVELAKLGFTASQIGNLTPAFLDLGSVSGAELAEVASVAGSTIRAFGLDASEAGRVVDVMASSFSKSALDLEKFSVASAKVAPIAKQLGFSIEDTTAIIAKLADSGLDASTVGTSLRSLFLFLADDASALSKAMGDPIRDIDGLTAGLAKLKDSGLDVGEALGLTDKRSVTAFLTLSEGAGAVKELSTAFKDSAGFARAAAEEIEAGPGGALRRLKSAAEGAALSLGRSLTPVVEELTRIFTQFSVGISNFVDTNPNFIASIAAMAAGALTLGAGLVATGVVLTSMGAIVSAGIATFTAAASVIGGLGVVIGAIASPIGVAVAAITVMTGLAVGLLATIEPLRTAIASLIKTLVDASGISIFLDRLKESSEAAIDAIKDGRLELAWKTAWVGVRLATQEALNQMTQSVYNFVNGPGQKLAAAFGKDVSEGLEEGRRAANKLFPVTALRNQFEDLRDEIKKGLIEDDPLSLENLRKNGPVLNDPEGDAAAAAKREQDAEEFFKKRNAADSKALTDSYKLNKLRSELDQIGRDTDQRNALLPEDDELKRKFNAIRDQILRFEAALKFDVKLDEESKKKINEDLKSLRGDLDTTGKQIFEKQKDKEREQKDLAKEEERVFGGAAGLQELSKRNKELLAKARDAAKSGDFEKADQLKEDADAVGNRFERLKDILLSGTGGASKNIQDAAKRSVEQMKAVTSTTAAQAKRLSSVSFEKVNPNKRLEDQGRSMLALQQQQVRIWKNLGRA